MYSPKNEHTYNMYSPKMNTYTNCTFRCIFIFGLYIIKDINMDLLQSPKKGNNTSVHETCVHGPHGKRPIG